jgi:hypothetical protein
MLTILSFICAVSGFGVAEAATTWQTFGFDGSAFRKGVGEAVIQVRDGYLPFAGSGGVRNDQLPPGTGAVAVLAFVQSAGGKLAPHSRPTVIAITDVAVTLAAKSFHVAGRTDANGYLIMALPPGSYDVRLLGFSQKVTVDGGKTALVAIRGGKRMVD